MRIEEIENEVEKCYQRLRNSYYGPCNSLIDEMDMDENIEDYIEKVDKDIDELIEGKNFMQAFSLIQKHLQFVNFLNVTKTTILRKLEELAQKLYQKLELLRQKLNARGFSIGFSIPFGVTLQLTF